MSTYRDLAWNPSTGRIEDALWIDDYFGRHRYGVQFEDGRVWPQKEVEIRNGDHIDRTHRRTRNDP